MDEIRLEIARIIKVNLPLMNKADFMIQNVADAILLYIIERKGLK